MINDKALANRLNAVKKGKEIPKSTGEQNPLLAKPSAGSNEEIFEVEENYSVKSLFLSSFVNISEIAIMSFLYGFGIQTILEKDWSLLGIFGVGFILNQLISLTSRLKIFQ